MRTAVVVLCGASVLSISAFFSNHASAAPAERPCRDDIVKHCSQVIGEREQMRACVRANYQKFSSQCQAALRERRQQNADRRGDLPPADPQPDS